MSGYRTCRTQSHARFASGILGWWNDYRSGHDVYLLALRHAGRSFRVLPGRARVPAHVCREGMGMNAVYYICSECGRRYPFLGRLPDEVCACSAPAMVV